jgi:heme A synthase
MNERGFQRLSISVLAYNLAVILWGAYVRASGSGAGCGSHWPDCNGEVIPRAPDVKMMIEFTHRATSGLALISVMALAWFAFRVFPKGSAVRRGAVTAVFFMLTEAAVGAGLVLLELVAENKSIARAWFMAIHLVNTFLLLASIALTIFWAHGGRRLRWRGQGLVGALLGVTLVGIMALGASGAITALGDTLFPVATIAEGMKQDASPASHIFLRLRVLHPLFAMLMSGGIIVAAMFTASERPTPAVKRASYYVLGFFVLQLILGAMNLALLAPVPIQLLHLMNADLVWISLVLLTASALQAEPAPA